MSEFPTKTYLFPESVPMLHRSRHESLTKKV
jgi:hypothetical protein